MSSEGMREKKKGGGGGREEDVVEVVKDKKGLHTHKTIRVAKEQIDEFTASISAQQSHHPSGGRKSREGPEESPYLQPFELDDEERRRRKKSAKSTAAVEGRSSRTSGELGGKSGGKKKSSEGEKAPKQKSFFGKFIDLITPKSSKAKSIDVKKKKSSIKQLPRVATTSRKSTSSIVVTSKRRSTTAKTPAQLQREVRRSLQQISSVKVPPAVHHTTSPVAVTSVEPPTSASHSSNPPKSPIDSLPTASAAVGSPVETSSNKTSGRVTGGASVTSKEPPTSASHSASSPKTPPLTAAAIGTAVRSPVGIPSTKTPGRVTGGSGEGLQVSPKKSPVQMNPSAAVLPPAAVAPAASLTASVVMSPSLEESSTKLPGLESWKVLYSLAGTAVLVSGILLYKTFIMTPPPQMYVGSDYCTIFGPLI